ncbi:amidohydrolase family protein [Dactylosporangium sp. CS-033363]|uniref:amidohydrolase family protein n=1 Tax=Dactylosporangium sp. CS-033363 TaxID=3239935 RepID=UPI003D93F267
MRVDCHAHASPDWFEPVEALRFQMAANAVDKAVLVQFTGHYDNAYALAAARADPDALACVVCVDAESPGARAAVRAAAEAGAAGLRLRAETRPRAIWEHAAEAGLVIDVLGRSATFAGREFHDLCAALPGTTIIVEHLGELRRENANYTEEQAVEVYRNIAPLPNVLLKIHGFGEGGTRAADLSHGIFAVTGEEKLYAALEVLGPDRLMWGSDFPACSAREGYANTLRYPLAALRERGISAADEASIFGGLADKVFFGGDRA